MIQIYPASSRFYAKNEWLESNFSFSFGPYEDNDNIQFGPLRVFNDDTIQPNNGFGIHPHRDAEIVTVVLRGMLKHEDSLGNSGILKFGDIQRMTAGTGILHSEVNPSQDEETDTLQIWFLPEQRQLVPSYEDVSYDISKLKNNLLPVVSKTPAENVAKIHQDLTLYLSKLDGEKEIYFHQEEGRRVYLFVIEGELEVNTKHLLVRRDAARIWDTAELTIKAKEDCFFMLIDLPGGD